MFQLEKVMEIKCIKNCR